MTFKGETVEISDSNSDILITGYLDPVKDLFMVPIDGVVAEKQRVEMLLTLGFSGAIRQRMETEYKGIVCPILLTTELHTAANTYKISCIPALILYMQACAGFPMIATWNNAINKGWYSTWPGLTASRVRKYLKPLEYTSIGYMKMISKGI